jgi:hypothetical protein
LLLIKLKTESNNEPEEPKSLHYINPYSTPSTTAIDSLKNITTIYNEYQQAIVSVGNVLEPYDTDKKYPVYGFGARLKQADGKYTSKANHCFPVNSGGYEVSGIDGILQVFFKKKKFFFN